MINFSQSIFQNHQKNQSISFKGKQDILLIENHLQVDNYLVNITDWEALLRDVLGKDKFEKFTVYRAANPQDAAILAHNHKPLFAISAFNLLDVTSVASKRMFEKIKRAGSEVIVYSSNWRDIPGIEIRKFGVANCENLCGASKFVDNYDWTTLKTTINALEEGKPIPRYNFQNDEKQWEYYKELANKAKNNKERLDHLDCLPAQYVNEEAKKLILSSDDKIKYGIADILEYLMEENQIPVAETLILNSDDDIKIQIFHKLSHLAKENQVPIAKMLILNSGKSLKMVMSHYFSGLSKENRVPIAETLILNSDNDIKGIIIDDLHRLPEENQVPIVKMLIHNSDNYLKRLIIYKLSDLSEENRVSILEELIQNSDNDIKMDIFYKLEYLLKEKHIPIREMLIRNSDDELKNTINNASKYLSKENNEGDHIGIFKSTIDLLRQLTTIPKDIRNFFAVFN